MNREPAAAGAASQQGKPVSIIVPTYREAENLRPLCESVKAVMQSCGIPYELIIADDCSPDRTVEIAGQLVRQHPLRLLQATDRPRDLALSVLDGIKAAAGEYLVVMDADLSHPVDRIPDLLQAVRSASGVFAVGSRYVGDGGFDRNWSLWRLLNSRMAMLLARPLVQVGDPMSGFFAVRKQDLCDLRRLHPIGYKIALELMVRCDFKQVVEVPITFHDRRAGNSKMNLKQQWNYLRHLRRLYVYRFGRFGEFVNFLAVGSSGFVIDIAGYYLLQWLGLDHRIARAVSFLPAVTWNWTHNRRTTFGDRKRCPRVRQWLEYIVANLLGIAISWGIYASLTSYLPWFDRWRLLAVILGVAVASVFNFIVSSVFVFSEKRR